VPGSSAPKLNKTDGSSAASGVTPHAPARPLDARHPHRRPHRLDPLTTAATAATRVARLAVRLLELGAHRAHHHLARRMVTIAPYYTNRGELYETIKPLRDQNDKIIGIQVRNARNTNLDSAGLDVPRSRCVRGTRAIAA
jgi:hypothetical protein